MIGMLFLALYWAVALAGLLGRRRSTLILLFFATLPLGTFAVVPPQLSGGLSLLGAPMTALLLSVREFGLQPGGSRRLAGLAFGSRPGRVLLSYWCVAAVVTAFAPRLFQGRIVVIPMSATVFRPTPLAPSLQNFSQLAYLTVSVLAVFAFASVFERDAERVRVPHAVLLVGGLTVATGLVDLVSTSVPLDFVLRGLRTAQYRLLDDAILADGTRRVVGLMAEASAFGGLSVTLFVLLYFVRQGSEGPSLRRRSAWVVAGLALMAVLSTSSAGYVAFGVAAVLLLLDWFSRSAGLARGWMARRGTRRELLIGLTVAAAVVAALLVAPWVFRPATGALHDRVLAKTQTDSYAERTTWTAVSLRAAVSSGLVGVGLGSTRASNFLVSLLASTGVPGVVLYFWFVLQLFVFPGTGLAAPDAALARALRWSYGPMFALDVMAGTTADFGVLNALRWGLLLALSVRSSAAAPALRAAGRRPVGLAGPA